MVDNESQNLRASRPAQSEVDRVPVDVTDPLIVRYVDRSKGWGRAMDEIDAQLKAPEASRLEGRSSLVSRSVSEKDQAVLDRIVWYCRTRFVPPTTQEIRTDFGWRSNNAVAGHLDGLRAVGLIALRGDRFRHEYRGILPIWRPGLCRVCGRPVQEDRSEILPGVPSDLLSLRQLELWLVMRKLHAERGRPATIRQLSAEIENKGWRAVQDMLARMLRKGAVVGYGPPNKQIYSVPPDFGCPGCGRDPESILQAEING